MPEAPKTLFDWLVQRFPTAKKQNLKRMAAAGRVRVNGKPVAVLKTPIAETDKITLEEGAGPVKAKSAVRTGIAARAPRPPRGGLRIVHEDADLLVVDKPAGLLTSTGAREKRPTLQALVQTYLAETDPKARPGLIHRLDRDASGLLVFSKNADAYHALKTQFFHHTVDRVYLAVVHNALNPRSGEIESWLIERADGSVYSTDEHGKGERAITKYETIGAGVRSSLVRVTLLTGRKHQIRVHLKERGCPIVGDPLYLKDPQKKNDATSDRLCLAAVRLSLDHPRSGERVTFDLPPPPEFDAALGKPAEDKAAPPGATK